MKILVDCAGARIGGAKRLLNEFDLYLRDRQLPQLRAIGRDHVLTAPWLLRRECPGERYDRSLALNNVSFMVAGRERRVLIHGPQHFLRLEEVRSLGLRISPAVHAQAPVVWSALRRTDHIFVPSTSMAERVLRIVPGVRDRVVVAFNPVTPPDPALLRARADERRERAADARTVDFLCPIIITPHKLMTRRLRVGLAALDILAGPPHHIDATITATAQAAQIDDPAVANHPRLRLVGEHPAATVIDMMVRCDAIFFPAELESFGYPMAEGRMMGVPVVALDNLHNREIAGPALVGYERETVEEIAAALHAALDADVKPDQDNLFGRGPYFDLLLGEGAAS
ncbi:glycosyltransferase [Frankia gtarii]|uniref:glycosyltransferase n=1 Tax=Frankia gtarii TaxID=2950102 RepID=UPI0021BF835F|nr:glycosyltransferase [Frankia gtarii]